MFNQLHNLVLELSVLEFENLKVWHTESNNLKDIAPEKRMVP